jgi:hypothetical protein
VSVTSSAGTVQAGGTLQITATVANDSANKWCHLGPIVCDRAMRKLVSDQHSERRAHDVRRTR